VQRTAAAVLALLVAALPGHTQQPNVAGTAGAGVGKLLSDVKSETSLLRSDVWTLDFFVSGAAPQAYAGPERVYMERLATIRGQAARLSAARQNAGRWQQLTIDRIVPLMLEFASSAAAAITVVRTSQNQSGSVDLAKYLKAQSDLADELYRLISAWVDYGRTRQELDQSEAKIEAAGASAIPQQ
jgi:hypothetical protein